MKKSVITLLIFLIMIISVSAASAADDAPDLGAADADALSIDNTDTAVAVDDNAKNFTDLNDDVARTSGDIYLGSDYIRNSTSEPSVTIEESKLIDGDDHIIDANGSGTIFIIRANINVTLQNVILKNTDNCAIVNYGNLILENVTFINCSDASISSESYSNLDVTGCTFEDYGINFMGVELSLSGNSFNNASKAFVTLALGTLTTPSTIYSSGYNTENWKKVNYVAKAKDDNGNLIAINDGWTVKIGNADVTNPTVVDGALNGVAQATAYGSQKVTANNYYLTNPTNDASNVTITPAEKVSEIGYRFSNESALQYGDNFNITVGLTNLYNDFGTFNATGTFTVLVNTVEYATLDVNATTGKAIFEFTNIARNNYDITIRYNGDDVYLASQTSYPTFTVGAKYVEPEVNVTIAEDGTQTVDIIFPSDATGTVAGTITKKGETEVVYTISTEALSEGKYSFNPELAAADYEINIKFVSTNPNYNDYGDKQEFTISKLNTTVEISVENTTYGNNVTITFTLASGVHNATYTITGATTGNEYTGTVNLTNGSYPLELDVPAADQYTITVASADDKYNYASNTTTFKVAPADTTITMVIGEVALFEDVEVNVTVKFGDKNGTGNVILYVVDDIPYEVASGYLDENGTATLTIYAYEIDVGENTIVAEFTSTNGNYSANSTSQTINVAQVTPTITVAVNDVKIGEDAGLIITLDYPYGEIPTGFAIVKLGDKVYPTAIIDDTGKAYLSIHAEDINEVAEYSVEVTYDPNGNVYYTANSTVFKFNVSYYDMEITVSDIANKTVGNNITFTIKAKGDKEFSQNFTVTIKDANGETVDTLSIALDNDATDATEVQFNLTQGNYTAVISYPGDGNYSANSTTTDKFSVNGTIENLTIEIAEVTYPNQAVAVVNASVDGTYNVTVEGKDYTVTVSQGTGNVTLDILAAADDYDAKVISLIEGYTQKTADTRFNVKPGKIEGATLTIDPVTYPEQAIAFVTSDVDGKYKILSENGLQGYEVEVINGTGNVTFTQDIPVGNYRFSLWTPENNANYTFYKVETKKLVVNKGTVDVNWTVEGVYYNAQANVVINASVDGTYTINVFNATGDVVNTTTVNLAKDEAQTLPIDILTPGTYTVNVTATIANYNDVELTKTFEVKTGIVYYSVSANEITYNPTTGIATITLTTTVEGTIGKGYAIYIDDVLLGNVTGADSNKTVKTEVLAAGNYTIKVVPMADDEAFTYYELGSESNSTTLTVNPAEAVFTIDVPTSVEYPNNVTVKVLTSNFEGNYTVVVGEITKVIEFAEGAGSVNITGLPVGGYIAYVTSDNANYTVVTKTATFSVNYGPINPTIESVVVPYNSPALVALTSNADGVYTITVNGKEYNITVKDGKGNRTIDDVLAVGEYPIKLTANIQDYVPYSNDNIATFKVVKANVGLSVNVTEVTYPEQAVATVTANASGIYSITVTNTAGEVAKYNVTITTETGVNGSASKTLDVLRPVYGPYTVIVEAIEYDNTNLTVTEITKNIVVNKATPVIIIEVLESYSIYDEVVVNVTVANADDPDEVTITCNSLSFTATKTIVNGSVNFTIPKGKVVVFGTQVISATISGGDFVAGVTNQTTFEVTQITPAFNITFNNATFEEVAKVTVGLIDLTGDVVPTGTITIINVGDKAVNIDGTEFELGKLAAGEYTLNITYTGDGNYTGISELYNFTVAQITPVVKVTGVTGATYPENATVTFTSSVAGNLTVDVYDADGTLVKSVPVYNVTADTATTVNIDGLDAGKYTANVTYVGTENYTSSTNASEAFVIAKAVNTIEATVATVAYPNVATAVITSEKEGKYTIVVTKGDAIIYYTANGTLTAGENSVELALLDAGDYNFTVTYESDDYTADPVSGTFTIAKGAATITIETDGATFPEAAIVNITSDATGDFTVTIGTFTTTGTFAGETVSVEAAGLGANTYDVVVDYAGNDNYNATTATGSLVIAKAAPVIYMEVDNTDKYGENSTLTITIPYATGTVRVNGKDLDLVDGVAKYEIGELKAETYELTAIYDGNDNLTNGNNFTSFTVPKLPANLVVTVENTTYGTNPVMTITLDNKEDLIVKVSVDGQTEQLVPISNGIISGNLTGLPAGDHNVTVAYEGSDAYEAETVTAYFNIGKANINVDITAVGGTYPDDIKVTVTSDVTGEYNLTIGATTVSINLVAGVPSEFVGEDYSAGTFDVTVSREATEDYNAVSKTVNVTLAKATPVITVTSSGATYPADVVATVTSDVSGKYTVTLGDEIKEIDLVAGVAQDVAFEKVNAGNYTITAAGAETENYTAASATADVAVAKGTIALTITASDVVYPNDVVVTVTSDVAGNYTLALGTTTPETIALEAGVAKEVTYSGLAAGTYTFTVASAETDNYNAADATATATVGKAAITVTIAADNVTYPADVVVTVTADVAGEYNLTVGTETEVITLEAGVAKAITKSGLTAGTYDITVARAESDNYAAVTQTASVNVAKVENTTISVEATSPSAGENATVTVTVPADATGTVTVKYGNGVYTADVVNGTATVSVPTAAAGTQTATVEYSGDANYASASSEVQITVKANGKIIAENIKRGVNSPYDYLATLVDNEGNPISGVEITFTILGQTYTATTNASGIATVSAGLTVVDGAATQYYVTITNPYTLENTTATTTIVPRLIVLSGDLTADYLENPAYTVQAFGDDGEAVGAGEIVQFVFAGKTYEIATNESGIAVRTIGLAPGQYAVKACYAGYNTTATVFKVNQVMKVTSGTLKKTAKSYTLKATLKSSDGKALAGKEVTLTFNGKKYTVTTDSKGVASYTIKSSVISKLKAGKTYTLYARYVNDVVKGKIKVVSK